MSFRASGQLIMILVSATCILSGCNAFGETPLPPASRRGLCESICGGIRRCASERSGECAAFCVVEDSFNYPACVMVEDASLSRANACIIAFCTTWSPSMASVTTNCIGGCDGRDAFFAMSVREMYPECRRRAMEQFGVGCPM